jgi:hypothetical protein
MRVTQLIEEVIQAHIWHVNRENFNAEDPKLFLRRVLFT